MKETGRFWRGMSTTLTPSGRDSESLETRDKPLMEPFTRRRDFSLIPRVLPRPTVLYVRFRSRHLPSSQIAQGMGYLLAYARWKYPS
jgi:hypothetical protein